MTLMYVMLLVGAACVSSSPIHNVPNNMRRAHSIIASHLDLTRPEVGSEPLFNSIIRRLNDSCQVDVMLMNATLDVYMRIFSHMLHRNPHLRLNKAESNALRMLKEPMETLQLELSRRQQNEDLLSKIHAIKVNDPLVQKKALAEALAVYNAASGLLHSCDTGTLQ